MIVTFLQSQDSANEVEDYESGDDIDGSPGQGTIKSKWSKVYFFDLYQIKNPLDSSIAKNARSFESL